MLLVYELRLGFGGPCMLIKKWYNQQASTIIEEENVFTCQFSTNTINPIAKGIDLTAQILAYCTNKDDLVIKSTQPLWEVLIVALTQNMEHIKTYAH